MLHVCEKVLTLSNIVCVYEVNWLTNEKLLAENYRQLLMTPNARPAGFNNL